MTESSAISGAVARIVAAPAEQREEMIGREMDALPIDLRDDLYVELVNELGRSQIHSVAEQLQQSISPQGVQQGPDTLDAERAFGLFMSYVHSQYMDAETLENGRELTDDEMRHIFRTFDSLYAKVPDDHTFESPSRSFNALATGLMRELLPETQEDPLNARTAGWNYIRDEANQATPRLSEINAELRAALDAGEPLPDPTEGDRLVQSVFAQAAKVHWLTPRPSVPTRPDRISATDAVDAALEASSDYYSLRAEGLERNVEGLRD